MHNIRSSRQPSPAENRCRHAAISAACTTGSHWEDTGHSATVTVGKGHCCDPVYSRRRALRQLDRSVVAIDRCSYERNASGARYWGVTGSLLTIASDNEKISIEKPVGPQHASPAEPSTVKRREGDALRGYIMARAQVNRMNASLDRFPAFAGPDSSRVRWLSPAGCSTTDREGVLGSVSGNRKFVSSTVNEVSRSTQ